jgi:class 3 adenylate cyclase
MVPGTRDEPGRAPRRGGRGALPGGAVTFVFTDIEGSTRLVKALRERYAEVLAGHRRLVRAAIAVHAGYEVDTQGDAFFAAFASAKQAVLCALEVQRALRQRAHGPVPPGPDPGQDRLPPPRRPDPARAADGPGLASPGRAAGARVTSCSPVREYPHRGLRPGPW